MKLINGARVIQTAAGGYAVRLPGGRIIELDGGVQASSATTTLGDSKLAMYTNVVGLGRHHYSGSHALWEADRLAAAGIYFDILYYRAVGGKTTAEVIAEQLPATLADPTDVAWLKVGANSLNTTLGNIAVNSYLTQMEDLIGELANGKKFVRVESIDPVSQSGSTGLKGRAFLIPAANAGVLKICSQYSNVQYLDTFSALVDPASALWNPKANHVLAADGIHDATIGGQARGYACAEATLKWPNLKITRWKSPGANVLPALTGTGGTTTVGAGAVTGTPPAGWNCQVASGNAAVTITQPTDGGVQLAMTAAADSVVYLQVINTSAVMTALRAQGAVQAQGTVVYQITAMDKVVRAPGMYVNFPASTGTPQNSAGVEDISNETTVQFPVQMFGGQRVSPIVDVPTTGNAAAFYVAFKLLAGGSLTVKLSEPSLVGFTG